MGLWNSVKSGANAFGGWLTGSSDRDLKKANKAMENYKNVKNKTTEELTAEGNAAAGQVAANKAAEAKKTAKAATMQGGGNRLQAATNSANAASQAASQGFSDAAQGYTQLATKKDIAEKDAERTAYLNDANAYNTRYENRRNRATQNIGNGLASAATITKSIISSDSNAKKVKHDYIPKEERLNKGEQKTMTDSEKTQAMKNEYLKQKGLTEWDDLYAAGFNEWSKGQNGVTFLNSLGKHTDSKGNEIKPEVSEENAKNQANAEAAANTVYSNATTQQDNGSGTQLKNTQKAADKVLKNGKQFENDASDTPEAVRKRFNEGKATDRDSAKMIYYIKNGDIEFSELGPKTKQAIIEYQEANKILSEEEAARLGVKISEKKEELSDEQINKTIEEVKNEEDLKKDITAQPDVDSQVADITGDTVNELTQEKADKALKEKNVQGNIDEALKAYAEAPEEEKLGLWDKIAVFATAVSAILMIASKGEVPFFPFTSIGGTEDRIGKLNALNDKVKEYNLNFKKYHNARYNYENDKKNGIIPANMSFEDYKKEVAGSQYGVTEKRGQDDADFETWADQQKITQENAMQLAEQAFGMKMKEMDKAHLQGLETMAHQAKLDIQKMIQAGNIDQAKMRLAQDLANRSKADQYKYVLAMTGDEASALRSIGLPSTGDSLNKWINSSVDNVTKLTDTVMNVLAPQ